MRFKGETLPLLRAKKEVFIWLKEGKKTIDVRKGKPCRGDVAYFFSGPYRLQLRIIKKETGRLTDLVDLDNFKRVIPSAKSPVEAIRYLERLYSDYEGVFTAYYVSQEN
jgi:ASC-1-like (ASCH) protein